MTPITCAIIGTAGLPARYGGFETLAENLARQNREAPQPMDLTVYCPGRGGPQRYEGARLRYVPLPANGAFSVLYDIISMLEAVRRGTDTILLLGVSGALALPLIRAVSRVRIVTNIDGLEWQRRKWGWLARHVLRLSERAAIRWSHHIVADNPAIARHVTFEYGRACHVIPYGSDHGAVLPIRNSPSPGPALAIARIEPENNVEMVLEAFARMPERCLTFVGNWQASRYGRRLRARFAACPNLDLQDAVYDPLALSRLRRRASVYIHGHSAGGTNPSLVEIMPYRIPVLAFATGSNWQTTEGRALYFTSCASLCAQLEDLSEESAQQISDDMAAIAERRYRWADVAAGYFSLLAASCRPATTKMTATRPSWRSAAFRSKPLAVSEK